MNKIMLTGNLTRDPELRFTPKGMAVVSFGLANNRKWKTESGEEREDVLFVDVKAFGKTAETIGQYFRKGQPILLEGRLKLEEWEDKQTQQKRSKLVVLLEHFDFFQKRNEGGPTAAPRTKQEAMASAKPPLESESGSPIAEDDVPF